MLEDGLLFVQVGGQPNSGVVAFDAATGKTVWENVGEKTWNGVPMNGWPGDAARRVGRSTIPPIEKQASYCTPVLATIHGRRHLLVCTRQGLVSLDPKTGAANFSYWFRARQDSIGQRDDAGRAGRPRFFSRRPTTKAAPCCCASRRMAKRCSRSGAGCNSRCTGRGRCCTRGTSSPSADATNRTRASAAWSSRPATLKWERNEAWPNGGHAKLGPGEKAPNVFGRGSAILADGKLIALGEAGLLGLFRPNPDEARRNRALAGAAAALPVLGRAGARQQTALPARRGSPRLLRSREVSSVPDATMSACAMRDCRDVPPRRRRCRAR